MVSTALILAGGLGTRLRSVVSDVPKPMAPVAGKPFLAHQLDFWYGQGIRRFVLSTGYRHEAIVDHFGPRYKDADLEYVVEDRPLGTGGGFLLAVAKLAPIEAFLLLNGDTYFAISLKDFDRYAESRSADWCLAAFQAREEGRYMGMELSSEGRIQSLRSGRPGAAVNGGVYWIHPRVLPRLGLDPGIPCSLENDLLPRLVQAEARLFAYECDGSFIDIGVPDDYHRAAEVLKPKKDIEWNISND